MTLRVAIAGAGGIGAQHAAALQSLGEAWQITQVCDLDPDMARRLADRAGARAASDLAAVMADPDVDVVDICLPPVLHVPTALAALAAGKHVVCEKPLAGSMADVDRLRAAAAAAGRQVFPVFQYRYGPAFRWLDALARAGLLGKPFAATLETHWNRGAAYYAVPWRGTHAHEMGGAVLSHAIHLHDLICRYFGPAAEVSALLDTLVNPIETEDCAAIALRTGHGGLVTSSITLGAADDQSRVRMVFEKATVESGRLPYTPGEAAWTVTARDPADQAAIDAVAVPAGRNGFAGYFADVAAALGGGPSGAVTLDDGAASIALVTAIYLSASSGARVHLPLAADAPFYQGWQPGQGRV